MTKTHAAVTEGGSAVTRYQDVVVGHRSLRATAYYEWCMWFAWVPGALGLFLRKAFWPRLFGSCGKEVAFTANIILRHPHRIHLGDRVVMSEGCILDARNQDSNHVISLGEDVILSNNVMVSCKNGTVNIGARTGINAQTIIQSTNHCPVTIGADVIIGPQCYIVGGGNYNIDRLDIPIWRQGIKDDGGIIIENDVWLGANVTVLGGVKIETGSVAGAGSIITKPVPARAVCVGQPARVMRFRDPGAEEVQPSLAE